MLPIRPEMSSFLQFAAAMREQMHATLSRSDVLRALVWPIGLILTALVALVSAAAPQWILLVFVVMFVLSILLYGFSYTFCLLNDRDALRSEKYSLNKIAIQHGLYGDDRTGYVDASRALPDGIDSPAALAKPESDRG